MSYVCIVLVSLGSLFLLGGCVGILRMPDFYTRLHPAGKLDTLGTMLMVLGLALYNLQEFSFDHLLLSIKMLLIVGFVFMSSPTATHAIVDAGIRAGLVPWSKKR